MKPLTLTYDKENDLKLDLYLPTDPSAPAEDTSRKLKSEKPDTNQPVTLSAPLFVYIHGGGLEGCDRTGPRPLFERLCTDGIAVASIDYRLYPKVKYPAFIEDCAKAIDFMLHHSGYRFSEIFAGGSSAGAYLSMMLLFDKHYLAKYGIDPMKFGGWVLDAGQPTVHFNILRERGLDTRLIRVDEAAPLYHIRRNFTPLRDDGKLPMILNLAAGDDMPGRLEQLKLLNVTLLHFGWDPARLQFICMDGYTHCAYDDQPIFAELIEKIIH